MLTFNTIKTVVQEIDQSHSWGDISDDDVKCKLLDIKHVLENFIFYNPSKKASVIEILESQTNYNGLRRSYSAIFIDFIAELKNAKILSFGLILGATALIATGLSKASTRES